jgi:hypothetical protein
VAKKLEPITFEQAAEDMRDMYDEFILWFDNDEAVAIVVGLNQPRFNKWLPELIIEDLATP